MELGAVIYAAIALILSIYQAYRGFMLQWVLGIQQIQGFRRVMLLCFADMVTFFVCTLSGFIALAFVAGSTVFDNHLPVTAGEATWLIFLTVYGLLGVTG